MHDFARILVALAHQPADGDLIRYSALLAQVWPKARFEWVHVLPAGSPPPERPGRTQEALEAHVETFLGEGIAGRSRFYVLNGEPVDRLLEFTARHRTDLVLMGHRRGRTGRRSLARRLAMNAPCSVWLAPEGGLVTLSRILVPVDLSARSADALAMACSLAAAAGIEKITALHVYFNEAAATYDEYEETLLENEEDAFYRFVARIDLRGIDVKPLFVESPEIARTILRAAGEQKADLIVMGTRGRSRSASILLGSETEHAIVETRIPLLAVKHFGARLPLVRALLDRRFQRGPGGRFT